MSQILTVVAVSGGALLFTSASGDAVAAGCADIAVVFARGTGEAPGVGWMGQQFIDALRWRTWGRALDVYPVDFPAVPEFEPSAAGIANAAAHLRDLYTRCPGTQLIVGGYSRGAALIGYVTDPASAGKFGASLPPEAASHVAAVALLGRPSAAFLYSIGAPPLSIGPSYAAKTIDLCALGDPVCSAGDNGAAHTAYAANGMTAEAADFAVDHLRPLEAVPGQPL
ncbi:cutinase family protein [Mycolicibacter minnesotensis]|uniref:Cutinase family protein n=1 Tax=Mycolicibacter minnesotensis TaxID=1118379 RepID=A0A7I7R242_9MYCO|nr:cutinase family protein [Mycolicibacter minnesotensis]ORB02604.1 cutinase family protein [Mycolicibacter minnesotensis]BBY32734.1 cutinase [Mycolicibacter minnesotensis]